MKKELVVGIDIGGTKIAVGLGTVNGEVISICRFPTPLESPPHQVMSDIFRRIKGMLRELNGRPIAIGVGCPGLPDIERGLLMSLPNLPNWNHLPIIELVKKCFDVPVTLDNDANAAALAEYKFGAGRGLNSIVYITISTGLGSGVIVNGSLVHGVGALAGEVGHMTVLPNGPECGCGARGCLEAVCSGTGIARRARIHLLAGEPSMLTSMIFRVEDITAQMVAIAAQKGDMLACKIWEETINYLAIGLGNIIVTLAPEAIILGGGVLKSGEYLLGPLRPLVQQRIKIFPAERIPLLQTLFSNDSGVYGAVALAINNLDAS